MLFLDQFSSVANCIVRENMMKEGRFLSSNSQSQHCKARRFEVKINPRSKYQPNFNNSDTIKTYFLPCIKCKMLFTLCQRIGGIRTWFCLYRANVSEWLYSCMRTCFLTNKKYLIVPILKDTWNIWNKNIWAKCWMFRSDWILSYSL